MHSDDALPPLQITEQDGVLRIEWDNRRVRKDRRTFWLLVIGWLFSLVLALVTSERLVSSLAAHARLQVFFWALWQVCGWTMPILIAYELSKFCWSELIEISPAQLRYACRGRFAPQPKMFAIDSHLEVFFGKCSTDDGTEWTPTLNIYSGEKWYLRRGIRIAIGLHPSLRAEIYQRINDFVVSHNIPLRLRRKK